VKILKTKVKRKSGYHVPEKLNQNFRLSFGS